MSIGSITNLNCKTLLIAVLFIFVMEPIDIIFYIVILATTVPVGMLLAWLCKDELRKDRKYFIILAYFFTVVLLAIALIYFRISFILTLIYAILILLILIYYSKNAKTL